MYISRSWQACALWQQWSLSYTWWFQFSFKIMLEEALLQCLEKNKIKYRERRLRTAADIDSMNLKLYETRDGYIWHRLFSGRISDFKQTTSVNIDFWSGRRDYIGIFQRISISNWLKGLFWEGEYQIHNRRLPCLISFSMYKIHRNSISVLIMTT